MAEKQETADDIIAEMLGARTEFPFVYLMGEPDTPEVIDPKTNKIIEPRKINIRRVTVKELADRLKAALRRERGDCAKLREAVKCLMDNLNIHLMQPIELITVNRAELDGMVMVCEKALAAPPRNCDILTDFNDAITTLADERNWHDGKWDSERYCILASWLFAPATEKEGGAE